MLSFNVGLNASPVVALGFVSIKSPERVGAAIKVPNHADFFTFSAVAPLRGSGPPSVGGGYTAVYSYFH